MNHNAAAACTCPLTITYTPDRHCAARNGNVGRGTMQWRTYRFQTCDYMLTSFNPGASDCHWSRVGDQRPSGYVSGKLKGHRFAKNLIKAFAHSIYHRCMETALPCKCESRCCVRARASPTHARRHQGDDLNTTNGEIITNPKIGTLRPCFALRAVL